MFHVKHFKKILYIIAVASFMMSTSCANVTYPDTENSSPAAVEENKVKELIPQTIKFAGQKMQIYTDNSSRILYDSTEIGSVKSAVQRRNDFLASEYGISIEVQEIDSGKVAEKLKETIESGVKSVHALCYDAETMSSLYASGYLTDMLKLPEFNEKACGLTDSEEDYQKIGQSLYMIRSSSIPYFNDLYCVYYSKNAIANAGLGDPELAVLRGEWTPAVFRQYSEAIAFNVMKKSSYDSATDIFGYSSREKNQLPALLSRSTGIPTIQKSAEGYPEIASVTEQDEQLASELQVLLKSRSKAPYYGSEAVEALYSGRLGMYIDKLSFLDVLYEKKEQDPDSFDYGIVPLPSGNGRNFFTPCGFDVPVIAVPVNTPLPDLSGIGVSLLCGAGRTSVTQAAIDSYVAMFSFGNDQSCMIDTIIRQAGADFGTLYGKAFPAVYNTADGLYADLMSKSVSLQSLLDAKKKEFDACIELNFKGKALD